MNREDVVDWLEYMKEEEHAKTDSIVPCDTEIALGMAIEALKQPEQKWISCNERLPERCGKYLVYINGPGCIEGKSIYTMDIRWWDTDYWWGSDREHITHWMPLPEKPEQ